MLIPCSDSTRLRVLEAGSGPALLLVPGWGMTADIWKRQFDFFFKDHRVVSFDPRGQGDSDKSADLSTARRGLDILELIEKLELKDVVLVGWSLAALDAISAFSQGASLKGLVLIDNTVDRKYGSPLSPGGRLLLSVERRPYPQVMEKFVRDMFKRPLPEADLQKILAATMKMPREAAMAALRQGSHGDGLSAVLARHALPVWYLVAPKYQKEALALAKDFPSLKAEVFEEAGHAVFIDDADYFNESLNSFMKHLP